MTMHIKQGGAWKEIPDMQVKVGGAWKQVTDAFVKVGGAWKQFYQFFTVSLATYTYEFATGNVHFRFFTDGDGEVEDGGSPFQVTWGEPITTGIGSDYDIRLTVSTGQVPTGAANGTWLNLSTTRAWQWANTGSAGTGTIEIRDASTLAVVDSTTYSVDFIVI